MNENFIARTINLLLRKAEMQSERLFHDLIHEGMHAWGHYNGCLKAFGWDGNLKYISSQVRVAMEVRAFDIERWFGNEKRNEELYQGYLETANKKVKIIK